MGEPWFPKRPPSQLDPGLRRGGRVEEGARTNLPRYLLMPILLAAALAASPTLAQMKWDRRVLIVAAPFPQDPALAGWDAAARERDLAVVTIVGDRVSGADDGAAGLRKRYRLPVGRFVAILIGKDGGEKLRSAKPIAAEVLAETIDAMPMRRAGER